MARELYFAYGSNMQSRQMLERCPDSERADVARLADHRLAFTRYSKRRASWVADIVQASGSEVWGVLYRISATDRDRLDVNEGHPTAYRREHTGVVTADGRPLDAWTYRVVNKQPEGSPATAYWRLLVEGAREHGLPQEYVSYLEALARSDDGPH